MRHWLVAFVFLLVACTAPEQRERTLGGQSSAKLHEPPPPSEHERLYHPTTELFEKKHPPKVGDWLERFPERGQSFLRYQSENPVRPTQDRNAIVLQPLGSFPKQRTELLETLRLGLSIFFQLPVELREPVALPRKGRRTRREGARRWLQYPTRNLLDEFLGQTRSQERAHLRRRHVRRSVPRSELELRVR